VTESTTIAPRDAPEAGGPTPPAVPSDERPEPARPEPEPASPPAGPTSPDVGRPGAPPPAPAPDPAALFERAREAVAALRGAAPGRRANGQAGPGNTLNLRTGLRSALLLDQPDVAAWHREQVHAITTDLGGEAELSALQRATVREVARLEVILAALGHELLDGGVLTPKGAMRAATVVYLQVLDRFVKVAATVGLQRRAKPIDPLDAVRQAVIEVNK
jgi:hypothetical protein